MVTQTHQPPPARARRQNKQVVLRHKLDHEPSTKQLLKLNCPNPTGQTPGAVTHTQEKQNLWRQREKWAQSRAPWAGPALALIADTLQFLPALTAGARLVMGVQSRQL